MVWFLVAILSLVLLGTPPEDANASDERRSRGDSPWIVLPSRSGEMTRKDRAAREELLRLIEEKRGKSFRERFTVRVPRKPTGLTENYDILMYGEYVGTFLLRLEVRVRGTEAGAEMITVDGVYRGQLGAKALDRLARQLIYAFQAKQKRRRRSYRLGDMLWWRHWVHIRCERIELISRDEHSPLHLRTEAWEPLADYIFESQMGVQGFAHTRLAIALEKAAREKLALLEPTDELRRDILNRLRRLDPPKPPAGGRILGQEEAIPDDAIPAELLGLEDYRRDDLASIEAKLYSRLAVDWRVAEAMPEFRRLGLDRAARRLAIAISDDPAPLLKSPLLTQDDDLFFWALDFTSQLPSPAREEVLVDAALHSKDGYAVEEILKLASQYELTTRQLAAMENYYQRAQDLRCKVAAATFLLRKTDDVKYYEFLRKLALTPKKGEKRSFRDPDARAISGILEYSAQKGKRRGRTVVMIRKLLEQIPMSEYPYQLVSYLGRLGGPEDVPLLLKYCDNETTVRTAILATAHINPRVALEKVRVEVNKYLKDGHGKHRFDLCVRPYLDLIFWQRDVSMAGLLEQALQKRQRERKVEEPAYWDVYGIGVSFEEQLEILIRFLRARDMEGRLHYALLYARVPWTNEEWLKDVGKNLVREGANPAKCRPLLSPDPDRGLGRWARSKEAETW